MMQYQIKEGQPYINVYEGEVPKEKVFMATKFVTTIEHDKWLTSVKSYRVKDEFETMLAEAARDRWANSGNYDKLKFKEACELGITLPLSISERVEIETNCDICPYGGVHYKNCLLNCSGKKSFAILTPLVVKEETVNEAVEFLDWAENDYTKVRGTDSCAWIDHNKYDVLVNGNDFHRNNLIYRYGKTTKELFEIFKNRK